MSDSPVRTLVHTDEGDLPFQHYFVRRRCEPCVLDLSYVGAEGAQIPPVVAAALALADVIVFCPSNPYLSIDPILSISPMRDLLHRARAPKIAVSPIVGGRALKGPAAKMMVEMGLDVSPVTVAAHYADLLNGFVIDVNDQAVQDRLRVPVLVTDTIMTDLASKARLARAVLAFAANDVANHRAFAPRPAHLRPLS